MKPTRTIKSEEIKTDLSNNFFMNVKQPTRRHVRGKQNFDVCMHH